MSKKVVNIGGHEFIEVRNCHVHRTFKTVYDCYASPSSTKISIWKHWLNWFMDNSEGTDDFINVSSYNAFKFTISGKINGRGFEITANHNHIEEVA